MIFLSPPTKVARQMPYSEDIPRHMGRLIIIDPLAFANSHQFILASLIYVRASQFQLEYRRITRNKGLSSLIYACRINLVPPTLMQFLLLHICTLLFLYYYFSSFVLSLLYIYILSVKLLFRVSTTCNTWTT